MYQGIEQLIIRPPSEASSVLIRVTRGCDWNRCTFCGTYDVLYPTEFSVRPAEDVKRDIRKAPDVYGPGMTTAFFGDSNAIVAPTDDFVELARCLYETFPNMQRLTSYGRAATVWTRESREPGFMRRLHDAGLSRLHVGLETGDDELLRYHRKGVSQGRMTGSGQIVVDSGVSLCYYVLLAIGGSDRQEQHIAGTAHVINEVNPDFVRFRRLIIHEGTRLYEAKEAGEFRPQTPEGTVHELRGIIAGLDGSRIRTRIECDHSNNYFRVSGKMPDDQERMLGEIDAFLALPEAERERVYRTTLDVR